MFERITFEKLIVITFIVATATAFFIGSRFPGDDFTSVVSDPMVLFVLLAVLFSLAKLVSLIKLNKEDWISVASILIGMGIIIYVAGPQMTVFSSVSKKYLGIYSSDKVVAQLMGSVLAFTGVYALFVNDVFGTNKIMRRFGISV